MFCFLIMYHHLFSNHISFFTIKCLASVLFDNVNNYTIKLKQTKKTQKIKLAFMMFYDLFPQ